MSDRIGVMQKAKVEQVGTPQEIYERPKTLFVTTFIGQSNVIDATVRGRQGESLVVSFGDTVALTRVPAEDFADGKAVKLVVRPENIIIGEAGTGVPATVVSETYQGALVRYHLSVGGQDIVAERQNQSHSPGCRPTGDRRDMGPGTIRSLGGLRPGHRNQKIGKGCNVR